MRAPDPDKKLLQNRLETYQALLDLRERDLDKLHAETEAFLLLIDFLLSAGRVEAAREAISERLQ
ncbi:MAG: hypothetical protein E5X23_16705 [Mesorhizobium sp.]|uniref:hypothetical protein n=1 Tax=unclassified Mesorhizobium TaxID=325217 RepID=UPI000FCB6481|nr:MULTISPECIES: hypothetical protein [unclassified Mesorhizobium]MCT2575710.1 hypothetical protein [Mesorhizobium sp. P13.3]MDF3165356.1 hypothetical protein [Mesorhizobium sp. P16.1]MDF3176990.1 hypothetical protein [Mesorhizobium sp. P17.1]MDF3182268.1 hypothetical protein [Mesorhizobium sp. ICCV3110.1]RUV24870.1 hypothetical protein EOA91_10405 [Mesorhizobium sp. M1A.F.Ca.IN.022.04.1.1]